MLLSRVAFKDAVFARDKSKCIVCDQPAEDAHHLIERRLFPDGGYYLENGVAVCSVHHIEAEQTTLSPASLRELAGIKKVILPPHLYDDQEYDKWGNPILPNGSRLKGELFYDTSVQKILDAGGVLSLFTQYVKYPRTHHLPWSLGMNKDDRIHKDTSNWEGKEVVVTKKMDGENTTMYDNHVHARSISSARHPTRTWIKNFWSSIAHEIPHGWRVCGENLQGRHSISYDNLKSYFLGFSLWTNENHCVDWYSTVEWFGLVGIEPVEILYEGLYDEMLIKGLQHKLDFTKDEGYVLRTIDGFSYGDFRKYVGKFVRPNHVQTTKHWLHGQPVVYNQLQK